MTSPTSNKKWLFARAPSPRMLLAAVLALLPNSTLLNGVSGLATSRMIMTMSNKVDQFADDRRSLASVANNPRAIQRKRYTHDGFQLTYRHLPATTTGEESSSCCLLIHPVGIGLSSWYWEEMMYAWQQQPTTNGGPPPTDFYAPDLIGCGINHGGGDAWDPDQRGLFFPLDWVRACETLLQDITTTTTTESSKWSLFGQPPSPKPPRPCTVITQGGLAPVGVMLAARNPLLVSQLVLSSPPTWKDMTTPIPQSELQRNYDFLRSPILGTAAFQALETKWAIEFFSNAFLFANRCNDKWLDYAMAELNPLARPPIQAFNAGFLNHRSFQEELTSLVQPTLILSGEQDEERRVQREPYQQCMSKCQLETLPGKNVLAWESPNEFVNAVSHFSIRTAP